ncbi:Hypothetical predicted protein, partial [Pelobates cultripes]
PTLVWRSLFRPQTTALRQHSIPYRWAFPMSLVITHGGTTSCITNASQIDTVLKALGLASNSEPTTLTPRQRPPHTWDMSKVKPFQPTGPTPTLHLI